MSLSESHQEDPELWCDHESWECTVGGGTNYHKCANGCGYSWIAGNRGISDLNCAVCYPEAVKEDPAKFVTKDSGKREEYDSGMVRDTQEGKARFDLLVPLGVPYKAQFLTRVAELLARGAEKYSDRNWEKARGADELARFKSSGNRHMMQWMAGETDEDHAAGVVFNLLAYETIKWKMENGP